MGSLKGVIREFREKDEESGQRMARIMRIFGKFIGEISVISVIG